jgi:hypothetical protein
MAGMRLAALLLLIALPAGAAERPKVDIACIPGSAPLAYDCTIIVRDARTQTPINHVEIVVEAAMPSANSGLSPVRAVAAGGPGTYRARLTLTAHGDWTLRLRLSGPVTDLISEELRFEAARPAQRR